MDNIKCPVCETEMPDDTHTNCPNCDWEYTGIECLIENQEENEDNFNPVSIAEAKRLVAKGKNIWGEPLPTKPAQDYDTAQRLRDKEIK